MVSGCEAGDSPDLVSTAGVEMTIEPRKHGCELFRQETAVKVDEVSVGGKHSVLTRSADGTRSIHYELIMRVTEYTPESACRAVRL